MHGGRETSKLILWLLWLGRNSKKRKTERRGIKIEKKRNENQESREKIGGKG